MVQAVLGGSYRRLCVEEVVSSPHALMFPVGLEPGGVALVLVLVWTSQV